MFLSKKTIALLALALVGLGATTTRAEISQRDQEQAAQSAYEAAAKEYDEVASGAQGVVDVLTDVRDGAIEVEKDLIETLIEE